jgi:hypothetical protein
MTQRFGKLAAVELAAGRDNNLYYQYSMVDIDSYSVDTDSVVRIVRLVRHQIGIMLVAA